VKGSVWKPDVLVNGMCRLSSLLSVLAEQMLLN